MTRSVFSPKSLKIFTVGLGALCLNGIASTSNALSLAPKKGKSPFLKPKPKLLVGTYNMLDPWKKGTFSTKRQEKIVSFTHNFFEARHGDFLGTQEALNESLVELANKIPVTPANRVRVAVLDAAEGGELQKYTANILYNAAKWRKLACLRKEVVTTKKTKSGDRRGVTGCIFENNSTKARVWFFSAWLPHGNFGEVVRNGTPEGLRPQILDIQNQLREQIKKSPKGWKSPKGLVLVGDMNEGFAEKVELKFPDERRVGGPGLPPKSELGHYRSDYVLVNEGGHVDRWIPDYMKKFPKLGEDSASDHLPVLAKVSL